VEGSWTSPSPGPPGDIPPPGSPSIVPWSPKTEAYQEVFFAQFLLEASGLYLCISCFLMVPCLCSGNLL
jgi:hypothetical protein